MPAIPWRRLLRALVLCALIPVMNAGADAESTSSNPDAIREGNRAFRGGNYEAAISRYLASHPQAPDGAVARFNLGVAYYRLGDYAQAELWLLRSARDARFSSKARYNLGL